MKNKPSLAVLMPLILLLFAVLFQAHLVSLESSGQFQLAYRWQPWRGELLEKSAFQAAEKGDFNGAIDFFLQARQQNGLTLAGQQALAEAYLQTAQPDLALREWESLRANGLQDPEMLLRMARLYHQQADFVREAEVARAGIELAPALAEFHWRLGLLEMARSPLEAFPFFERIQAFDPQPDYPFTGLIQALDRASLADSPAYQLTVSAQALAALDEWTLARAALERAVEFDPEYAPAWALLAESRQQTGAPEALAALERAVQLDPQSASNHAYLGLYWQRQRDFVRAGQSFQRAARLEPQNPIWLMNLGELAFLRGDVPTAHTYYLQATLVAPANDLTWRALALFCLQTEGCLRQDGLPAALKARSLAPEDWSSADVLGQVFMALGEDQSARALLTRAVELAPAEAAPRFHLGLLHLRSGDTLLARENLQAALALDPDGPLAETIRSVMERYLP